MEAGESGVKVQPALHNDIMFPKSKESQNKTKQKMGAGDLAESGNVNLPSANEALSSMPRSIKYNRVIHGYALSTNIGARSL